jgi:nucleoside 2-deoxyribosyltransferase
MRKKIVISSSMKFIDLIKSTMKTLNDLGFEAIFPNLENSQGDVELSLEEKTKLAWDHYYAIEEADAVYFILPEGYMGTSCKIELGYALALKKPVYFSELTGDNSLDAYPEKVIALENLNEFNKLF